MLMMCVCVCVRNQDESPADSCQHFADNKHLNIPAEYCKSDTEIFLFKSLSMSRADVDGIKLRPLSFTSSHRLHL